MEPISRIGLSEDATLLESCADVVEPNMNSKGNATNNATTNVCGSRDSNEKEEAMESKVSAQGPSPPLKEDDDSSNEEQSKISADKETTRFPEKVSFTVRSKIRSSQKF